MPERFCAKSRDHWREWLQANHKKENEIWLVKYKRHTNKPTVTNKEAMEEAICFGWIDTIVKKLDYEKYMQKFVKRNDKSRWSNNTLRYAREMIEQGKMAPQGLKRYKEGLKKPTIDHGLPKNPDIPDDLKKALDNNKKAKENFENFAPSYRRFYIIWVARAKRQETRKKRIKEVLQRSAENKKPGVE
ncbi:YdeI family protein [Nanoarchaeota archaeon]